MNRRTFLTSMLAACAAPAIVRADSLMRIVPRDTAVFRPYDFTDELRPLIIFDSNPTGTNSWLERHYREQISRMSRELAEAIDRDILEALTGKRLTMESEAPKFPSVASSFA